jgi:hypothetical protein
MVSILLLVNMGDKCCSSTVSIFVFVFVFVFSLLTASLLLESFVGRASLALALGLLKENKCSFSFSLVAMVVSFWDVVPFATADEMCDVLCNSKMSAIFIYGQRKYLE